MKNQMVAFKATFSGPQQRLIVIKQDCVDRHTVVNLIFNTVTDDQIEFTPRGEGNSGFEQKISHLIYVQLHGDCK